MPAGETRLLVFVTAISMIGVAACVSVDRDGVNELSRLRDALRVADTAHIVVKGYDPSGNDKRECRIELSDVAMQLDGTIRVKAGPYHCTEPNLSTMESISVELYLNDDRMYTFEIVGGQAIRLGKEREYFAKLEDRSLEQALLESCNASTMAEAKGPGLTNDEESAER